MKPKKEKPLSIQQQRFCDEYILNGGNVTDAALKAGFAESTAMKKAFAWVGKSRETSKYPLMFDYIKQKRRDLENEYEVTRGAVLKGMHRIAAVDIRKMFNEFGGLKDIHELDDETVAAIAGIEIMETFTDPETGITTQVKKIKLSEKNTAWANIAKMLGYNQPEKIQHEVGETFLDFLKKASAGID